MKKVLSLLVAFVFLQVQSWALSGGPVFTHNGNPSIIGTYGGVLIPTSSTTTPTTAQPASIGIFSVSVPETGISAGAAIIFVNGVAFIGQIAGVGDGDKETIQGLIAGTSSFTIPQNVAGTVVQTSIIAEGSFKAQVIQGDAGAFSPAPAGSGNGTSSSSSSTGGSSSSTSNEVGSTNSARLKGTAQVGTFYKVNATTGEPNIDVVVTYAIDGIKQNNIPANVNTVPFSFSAGGTGS